MAGIHSIAQQPTRKFATNSQIGDPISAIEMNNDPRRTSQTTITLRRSNLSASTPPMGAKRMPGSSWVSTTSDSANDCHW